MPDPAADRQSIVAPVATMLLPDQAALAALAERQASERRAADYRRQIAAIDRRLKALEDRAFVDDILNATLRALEVPDD